LLRAEECHPQYHGATTLDVDTMHDDNASNRDSPVRSATTHATPDEACDVMRACAQRSDELVACATDAATPDAVLFARLVAAREMRGELPLLGLSRAQLTDLFDRHFAHCELPAASRDMSPIPLNDAAHADFVAALRALLLQHANKSVVVDDAQCLASIIAHACLRPDHLWRDLGLSGREEVSAMLERYFPTLVARNVANLRWKKFLAQQLAFSLGEEPGPAPGCPGCEDFAICFPPGR
jgi:nitrogen fixation protein NifQ